MSLCQKAWLGLRVGLGLGLGIGLGLGLGLGLGSGLGSGPNLEGAAEAENLFLEQRVAVHRLW